MQWWDEDHGLDGFYSITEAGSAFNYFHRKDGKVVGLWKRSLSALFDDGLHFSKPVKSPTFVMAGGKMWGQANKDGSYDLSIDGKQLLKEAKLAEAEKSVERVSFRTGTYRNLPNRNTPNQEPAEPLKGADEPVVDVKFFIDDFTVYSK